MGIFAFIYWISSHCCVSSPLTCREGWKDPTSCQDFTGSTMQTWMASAGVEFSVTELKKDSCHP